MTTAANVAEFTLLYQQCAPRVRGRLLQTTRNPDLADDLTQDAFAAAWRAWDSYHEIGSSRAGWIFRIALNALADYRRWAYHHNNVSLEAVEGAPSTAREAHLDDGLALAEVAARMAALPRHEAEAVVLTAAGYSDQETADRLGISRGAVRTRVSRGRAKLRAGT